MELQIGMTGEISYTVTEDKTAAALGSGLLPVFGTPYLVALMESAACEAVKDALPAGSTTVGTRVDVSHQAATPIGMTVRAVAVLDEIDRRALYFTIHAYDDAGVVGVASHTRFIVDIERFMQKAQEKRS